MGELVSVGKLREWLNYKINRFDSDNGTIVLNTGVNPDDLYDLADEIEREVAYRYMLLPVDMDGVPIHLGDCCEMNDERFEVRQLRTDGDYWWAIDRLGRSLLTTFCSHVKLRTIEDVLRAFYHDASDADAFCTVRLDDVLAKYAAELRGMMEADDD